MILEGSRYLGRTVHAYYDPLTERQIQFVEHFNWQGETNFPDNRVHVVKDGDTLDGLAHIHLGNSRWWWVIGSVFNNIMHADDLKPGDILIIPNMATFQTQIQPRLRGGKVR